LAQVHALDAPGTQVEPPLGEVEDGVLSDDPHPAKTTMTGKKERSRTDGGLSRGDCL
jgi:hypothetical protein